MKIEQLRTESTPQGSRWSARVGGHDLWFETPMRPDCPNPADSFVVMALPPAMLAGTDVVVEDGVVSAELLEHLDAAQNVLHAWSRRFKRVRIRTAAQPAAPPTDAVVTMYSGGVDSMYSLVRHASELTAAILIAGFDLDPTTDEAQIAAQRNRDVVERRGCQVWTMTTNQRLWGRRTGVSRSFVYPSYLAACALFFGARQLYIPSGCPYGPIVDASQPYLDPLWSNGRTRIEQSGGDTWRSRKLEAVIRDPHLLAALRVCYQSQNVNCGKCVKCRRTMITLRLLGKAPGPFPRTIPLSDIRSLSSDEHELHFVIDNLRLAADVGDREVLAALKTAIRRYDRSQVLVHLDRWLLGGRLRAWRKSSAGYGDPLASFVDREDLQIA